MRTCDSGGEDEDEDEAGAEAVEDAGSARRPPERERSEAGCDMRKDKGEINGAMTAPKREIREGEDTCNGGAESNGR